MKNHGQSTNHHTVALANAQLAHAANRAAVNAIASPDALATVYRIYTEDNPVVTLVSRYFDGASLFHPTGIWKGNVESGLVIEILGTFADRANVVQLAADIAAKFHQELVLVCWHNSKTFETVKVFGNVASAKGSN